MPANKNGAPPYPRWLLRRSSRNTNHEHQTSVVLREQVSPLDLQAHPLSAQAE
jgi:hypothetical protein